MNIGPDVVGAARLNPGARASPENNHNDPTGNDDDPCDYDYPNHHNDASPDRTDDHADNAENCADQHNPGHRTSNHFDFA